MTAPNGLICGSPEAGVAPAEYLQPEWDLHLIENDF
jgi:hypothetical protein